MRTASLLTTGALVAALSLAGCATPVTTAPDKSAAPAAVGTASSKASAAPKTTAPPKDVGTVSQRNALRSAQSYIDLKGFSKAGLIGQLSSSFGDKFSKADATWAVAHLAVDWNEQAVRAGQAYLELKGFSRSGLIEQLSSPYGDKFTKAEATHAAEKLGLK